MLSAVMKPTSDTFSTSLSVAEEPKLDPFETSDAPPLPIAELKLMALEVVMLSTLVSICAP
ncbi:hypothetical protein D3C80_2097260 [compost metagenome]